MKLNLGCGFDKREGWLNVDSFAECQPDQFLDIEQQSESICQFGFLIGNVGAGPLLP